MLVDTFLYNGEEDILDWRYHILRDSVDFFLGIYADQTFTGILRKIDPPMYPGMGWLRVENLPGDGARSAWKREMFQRNAILGGLGPEIGSDDLILLSDVDEIPDPKLLSQYADWKPTAGEIIRFRQQLYHFNFNNRVTNDTHSLYGWNNTTLCDRYTLTKLYPQGVRNSTNCALIEGGYHFSWFWKPQEKLDAYSHQELKAYSGTIPEQIAQRWHFEYERVEGTSHLPQYIQDTQDQWSHYFEPTPINL